VNGDRLWLAVAGSTLLGGVAHGTANAKGVSAGRGTKPVFRPAIAGCARSELANRPAAGPRLRVSRLRALRERQVELQADEAAGFEGRIPRRSQEPADVAERPDTRAVNHACRAEAGKTETNTRMKPARKERSSSRDARRRLTRDLRHAAAGSAYAVTIGRGGRR